MTQTDKKKRKKILGATLNYSPHFKEQCVRNKERGQESRWKSLLLYRDWQIYEDGYIKKYLQNISA